MEDTDTMQSRSPLEFIRSVSGNRHMVMLYEDPEYAFQIQSEFIRAGLENGEHCVFTTHEGNTEYVEKQMESNGIDVDSFRRTGLLHLYSISSPASHPEGPVRGAKKLIKKILAGTTPPVRVASTLAPEIHDTLQAIASAEVERATHDGFDGMDICLLCSYDMRSRGKHMQEWMVEILQSHHDAIFAPRSRRGIAFTMR